MEKVMNKFKDQLDAAEKEKVTKLIAELRELAVKGQAANASVTAKSIKEKIVETQQASLGLFQRWVYEKQNAKNNASSTSHKRPPSEVSTIHHCTTHLMIDQRKYPYSAHT
ncbi:hypothetical protein BJV74DRAFT_888571 [Russula compacta]|nr:hypothetical protein BJV74DRAFT_888571 [Russula compacta]